SARLLLWASPLAQKTECTVFLHFTKALETYFRMSFSLSGMTFITRLHYKYRTYTFLSRKMTVEFRIPLQVSVQLPLCSAIHGLMQKLLIGQYIRIYNATGKDEDY